MIAVEDAVVTFGRSLELDPHEIAIIDVAEGIPGGRLRILPLVIIVESAPGSLEELHRKKLVPAGDLRTMNPEVECAQVERKLESRTFLKGVQLIDRPSSRGLK